MMGEKRETIDMKPILTVTELSELKKEVELVFLHEKVAGYALNLVHASRNHDAVLLGMSPRGSEAFVKAAKAYALLKGRQHVVPSDFQKVLPACFSHRIQLKNKDVHHNNQMAEILEQIIQRVPIPIRRD